MVEGVSLYANIMTFRISNIFEMFHRSKIGMIHRTWRITNLIHNKH